MSFRAESLENEGAQIVRLSDDEGNGLEVWPTEGFNAYRWFVEHGGRQELLYSTPEYFSEKRPTRSGNPILFPFPNRIRDGRFVWEGTTYQLPLIDPARQNGIHGFATRHPWARVEQGSDANHAWVRAEFLANRDAGESFALWPTNYRLCFTYRFFGARVRLDMEIENPDTRPLPFGLGFHPYFSLSAFGREEAVVGVPAQQYWPLEGNLPVGTPIHVEGMLDLRDGKECGSLHLDHLLTDLDQGTRNAEGLYRFGWIMDWQRRRQLELFASPAFREVVVFNPPHREAFCIEPYTCATDAANLQQKGINAGWQSLGSGERWTGAMEFVFRAIG